MLSKGIRPSGNATDTVNARGRDINITICDVTNPCIFVKANDFGITGYESAAELTANETWVKMCDELRGKAAMLLLPADGWTTWHKISPFSPLPIFVAPSESSVKVHLSARLFLDMMCHESMAGTGAVCTAACRRVPGTIVNQVVSTAADSETLEIIHPIGVTSVCVQK